MAFFRNNQVNLLNIHHTLYAFAANAGGIFVAVYFLQAGISIAGVLCVMALIMVGRFLVRPLILPLAKELGLRILVGLGTLGIAVQYVLAGQVHGVGLPLFAYCAVSAVADAFYWTCFHAYFTALGDSDHRGHQTSMREALAALAAVVAPLIGAWSLTHLGPQTTFAATAVVQACAALPLLGTQNVAVKKSAPGAIRAAAIGIRLGLADGWMLATFVVVWQLALFTSLGRSMLAFGGAMAVAALAGAATGLVAGRLIDVGHATRAIYIACAAMLIAALTRAASAPFPFLAVAANAVGTFAFGLYAPVVLAPVYNAAKKAPCPLRFSLASEGATDIGFAAGCLTAAALLVSGASLPSAMLLSVVGPAASFAIWRRYLNTEAFAAS